MALTPIYNRDSGSEARTKINDAFTAIDTNTADILTKQPLDADLTAIAALSPSANDTMQYISGSWKARTVTEAKTTFSLQNVDNTSDANKPISTATQTALDLKQTANAESTLIDRVASTASTITIGNSDNNSFKRVTNAAATDYILPSDASAPSLSIGSNCGFYNSSSSTNNVTIQNDGGSTVLYANSLTSAVAPGQAAQFKKLAANTWLRVV